MYFLLHATELLYNCRAVPLRVLLRRGFNVVGKDREGSAGEGKLLPRLAVVLMLAKVGHDVLQRIRLFGRQRAVSVSRI